jgi:hypothetical protein
MECKVQYLSPTSLNTFESAPDVFVLNYVIGIPRRPQLKVMAVGSAFDAHVKGALAKDINEISGVAEQLIEAQVIAEHRKEVNEYGKRLLQQYIKSGSYARLLSEIGSAESFAYEFDAKTTLDIDGVKVPVAGKPDLFFRRTDESGVGINVILDWKVSGFFTKASPVAGYSRLVNSQGRNLGPHKDCMVIRKHGFEIGVGGDIKNDWKDQITIYTWCMKTPAFLEGVDQPGDDVWVVGVDQLCITNMAGKYVGELGQTLKIASFRKIKKPHPTLGGRLKRAWSAIQAQHYYTNMSKDESDARVATLAEADDSLRWAILDLPTFPGAVVRPKAAYKEEIVAQPGTLPTFEDTDTHVR